MKKILLPLFAFGFMLFSCKKDYTCTCYYTETMRSTNLNETFVSNNSTTFDNVTKRFVEDELECYTTETSYVVKDYYVGDDPFNNPIYEDVNVNSRNECSISKK